MAKEGKGRGKGNEGKRNKRKITVFCLGGKGCKRKKNNSFLFKSFQLQGDSKLDKNYLSNYFKSLPSIMVIQIKDKKFYPSPSFPSISFHLHTPNAGPVLSIFRGADCLGPQK